jgi:hypothetical protein
MTITDDFNTRFIYLLVFTIVFAIYNVVHAGSMKLILEKAAHFKRK